MLTTRLITAAILLPLFIGALLWLPNTYWAVVLLPLLLVGSREWARLAGYGRNGGWLFSGAVLLPAALWVFFASFEAGHHAAFCFSPDGIACGIATMFWVFLAPAWLKGKWRVSNPLVLGLTGWIMLVPTWMALVRLQAQPPQLLALLGIVWIADTAAYLAGRGFGRRKLAPEISPGKTWEGVIGAGVAVAVYYGLLRVAFGPATTWLGGAAGFLLCGAITIMSIEGDLFESWIKRQAGMKDSGSLLPGHGGVLDRIDGLTASMPLAVLVSFYLG